MFKILAHLLRDSTETNSRKVVDSEARIGWVFRREKTAEVVPERRICETFFGSFEPHHFDYLIEENLDEYPATRCSVLLRDFDYVHTAPINAVRSEEVAEETRDVAQPVCFVTVYRVVEASEGFLETFMPHSVEFGETLTDKSIELVISAFLRTALYYHVA